MKTNPALARRFCEELYKDLRMVLSDNEEVRRRVAETKAHAPKFPEVRFCKACVLPEVDRTATRFLRAELGLTGNEVSRSLRCEGFSTLHSIYVPGDGQAGYSNYTWGTNYQPVSKTGKIYPSEKQGYQPCPDFGIVHAKFSQKFSMVGEVKYSAETSTIANGLRQVVRDLKYYVGLPLDPTNGWDYDFGFGIAYAAGGLGARQSLLVTEYWEEHHFMVACFQE